jgi:uncharacterized membrane protein YkvI
MRGWFKAFQISCTYIGTMVGAGFASGQEILQFFTRFGGTAVWTIGLASALFVWIGTKQMLLAHRTGSATYEDLNRLLFGERFGRYVTFLMTAVLFGTVGVMLAGAGSIFSEHLHLPYQLGLIATAGLAYGLLRSGMRGILAINTITVPMMLIFIGITVWVGLQSPNAGNWLTIPNRIDPLKVWIAPFLYVAMNMCLAQAILVPIGHSVRDSRTIRLAGIMGGLGIGLLLIAAHFALSAQMPGIGRYEIPMAILIHRLGPVVHSLFLIVIYSEIFTTLIADAFGLTHQLGRRLPALEPIMLPAILAIGYAVSLIGFSNLVSTLYPLFGMMSIGWLVMLMLRRA